MKFVLQILILIIDISYINVKKRENLRMSYSNINLKLKIF